MRVVPGSLVTLNREGFAECRGSLFESIEELRDSISTLSGLFTGSVLDEKPITGIVLRKWTREAVVPSGRGSSLRVMTFVEVAWSNGCCTCPIEILSTIKGD